jgi:hypothetical protein
VLSMLHVITPASAATAMNRNPRLAHTYGAIRGLQKCSRANGLSARRVTFVAAAGAPHVLSPLVCCVPQEDDSFLVGFGDEDMFAEPFPVDPDTLRSLHKVRSFDITIPSLDSPVVHPLRPSEVEAAAALPVVRDPWPAPSGPDAGRGLGAAPDFAAHLALPTGTVRQPMGKRYVWLAVRCFAQLALVARVTCRCVSRAAPAGTHMMTPRPSRRCPGQPTSTTWMTLLPHQARRSARIRGRRTVEKRCVVVVTCRLWHASAQLMLLSLDDLLSLPRS